MISGKRDATTQQTVQFVLIDGLSSYLERIEIS